MIKTIDLTSKFPKILKLAYIAAGVFFLVVFGFSSFYLFTGYYHLADWYQGLNSCFFRSGQWRNEFFTQNIKTGGNKYCLLAIAISAAGIWYIARQLRASADAVKQDLYLKYDTGNIIPALLYIAAASAAWIWGNGLAKPAYDEVFSAQNAAGIHPFQCISYYMAPNNHLCYNFINSLLFHSAADQVTTGRILSLAAYYLFGISIYFVLYRQMKNRWLALLVSITLSLQFFTWGFSFQARGYELYLLAECLLFMSLFGYLRSGRKDWLYLNIAAMVTGYFCLPSFLYFHAAQMLFMVLYQLSYRNKSLTFWKYQVAGVLITYLCYIPALCFSGMKAITANTYVTPMLNRTVGTFWEQMLPVCRTYVTHIFSDIRVQGFDVNPLLFLLPLALLFVRKNKLNMLFGLFYLSMWVTFFLLTTAMKRLPFERNLIGHYCISLAGVLWVAYWLSGLQSRTGQHSIVRWAAFIVIPVLFGLQFIRTNTSFLKDTLYEYDVNKVYNEQKERLSIIPAGSTIAFSDAEFYSYYICRKNGCKVSKCPIGDEAYYTKDVEEQFPPYMANKYELLNKWYGYEIYKRK